MQTLLTYLALAASLITFQANAAEQKGFLIKTEFAYRAKNKISKSESTFILDAKNQAWTTLTKPKDGIALLGRMTPGNDKSFRMEYMIIDTNQDNAVISTPAIEARLGEPAEVNVGKTGGESVHVKLLAEATEYSTKK